VTCECTVAAGKDSSEEPRTTNHVPAPYGEHARAHFVQPPTGSAIADRVRREPELIQLASRNQSVLTPCDLRYLLITWYAQHAVFCAL
jgi:hypothetical protein